MFFSRLFDCAGIIILLAGICSPLVVAHARSDKIAARIVGTVIDAETQEPLQRVEIYIKALQRGEVTGENGTFQLDRIPPGEYEVSFTRQGFKTHKQEIKLQSGERLTLHLQMTAKAIELDEVQVTANRGLMSSQDAPQMVSVMNAQDIRAANLQQAPEILREAAGVFVQKTNQGGGSPIIRGLKANKLLLLVDGIRLNNSTYRGGNHQYLNTVDAQALERVEVVHGPVSALYGSDALGGAVNVITRSPQFHDQRRLALRGSLAGMISTADHTQTGHLDLSASHARWGAVFDASFKSFGDVTRGVNGGGLLMQRLANDARVNRRLLETQTPQGYESFDLSGKLGIKLSETLQLTAAHQSNRQEAVPRYDVYEAQTDSIWQYAPQQRDLSYISLQNSGQSFWFDVATFTLSRHRQFERRKRQGYGGANENRDQYETVTLGAQAQFNKIIAARHVLVYGSEFYHDNVATLSTQRNTISGAISPRNPIYPDGAAFANFGMYAQAEFAIAPRWTVIAGARFSAFRLRAPFAPELKLGTVTQKPSALTGSLGTKIDLAEGLGLVANVAQGFRAPNLDDLSRLGRARGDLIFEIPNPDLKPETSLSFDAGIKLNFERVQANAIGYYNALANILARRSAAVAGLPFVIDEGDTVAVFQKTNAGRAYTTGFEIETEIALTARLALRGNLSYTYGQNKTDNEPLSAIPPLHGLAGLRFEQQQFRAEIYARFAAAQNRLAAEDRDDLRIPEGGTPGWFTLNLRAGLPVSKHLHVNAGLANVLDRNYREHVSGFNAPGRNFIAGAEVKF